VHQLSARLRFSCVLFVIGGFGPIAMSPLATAAETAVPPITSQQLRFWLSPIWLGHRIDEEPVLFIRNSGSDRARASLIFPPSAVLSLRNPAGTVTYVEGRDYLLTPGTRELVLTASTTIPFLESAELRRPANSQKYNLPHRDGSGDILFGSTHEYHDLQTWVTYTCDTKRWTGPLPGYAGPLLTRSARKLREADRFSIALIGDSISAGCNASGWAGVPPHQPPYPELLRRALELDGGRKVTLTNFSLGGSDSVRALAKAEEISAIRPDLLIIAFGMNDALKRPRNDYRDRIKALVDRIRTSNSDCEVILVASMLGNRDWASLNYELFFEYREALFELQGDGVAVADLTSIWEELLRSKSYWDLTGNGVNHPNDFGHRLYTQTLLTLLLPAFP